MPTRRLHLQRLLGRKVHDPSGACAGRIEEILARRAGNECLVTHYLLGKTGLAERLSIPALALSFLRPLGARNRLAPLRVPWDQLDLTDRTHPRLRCTLEELKSMQPSQK